MHGEVSAAEHYGLIIVLTGEGKGKTTAALGQVLRAVGHGFSAVIIQFLKGDPSYGEVRAIHHLPGVELHQCGSAAYTSPTNPSPEDYRLAKQGMELAKKAILNGSHRLIILDEINVALEMGLIQVEEVREILEVKPANVTVILTGRGLHPQLEALADTISSVEEVKHHWRRGVMAQAGIEF